MTVKKSLGRRIRGWFPQEPNASKAPSKTDFQSRIGTDKPKQKSLSFKTRRWLHGTSAFISSLMSQISLKTKLLIIAFGLGIFTTWLLYFLTISNFISDLIFFWAGKVVPSALMILIIAFYSYDYFNKRTYRKNHPIVNVNPNLRLMGMIIGGIAGAILVSSYLLLLSFVFSSPVNPSTIPFYLDVAGSFMGFLGWGLYMLWRKRNKLSPFNST